jgi:penicillin-binding protein 1A
MARKKPPSPHGRSKTKIAAKGKVKAKVARSRSAKKTTQKPSFLLWMTRWSVTLFIWFIFVFGLFALWFGYDLPDTANLLNSQRRPSITVLANDGKTRLATYGDLHGKLVRVETLPPHMIQALLSIEDRRFYYHFGVDPIGLVRAIYVNSQAGHVVQGGSTLTQQLAKNFLQSEKLYDVKDRSLRRKIQEALMALSLEWRFTKDQILTMYLNRVYFGSGTFGLEAAAYHYFGKSASKLSLYESAVLAGLLKAPTRFSPANNPDQADIRARQVLEAMVDAGYIKSDQRDVALLMASVAQESPTGSSVRYFCDWIISSLEDYVGLEDTDLIITSTLDAKLQRAAEDQMQHLMDEQGKNYNCSQMSLVSMAPTGAVRAMVGGANYGKSQFNRATQSLRQSGSTFKLFVYLAALENGYNPTTKVSDRAIRIGSWKPKNFMYKSKGEIPLQDALAFSVNTVTVRLAKQLGARTVENMAHRLGVTGEQPKDLSLALGTGDATLLQLTTAFSTLPNGGYSVMPYGITSIKSPEGKILYKRHEGGHAPVLDRHVVQDMNKMLSAVMSYGTGRNAAIGRPCAGKTGTSQKDRDALVVGYTPQLVTGVWAGNDDNRSMNYLKGGSMATRLWHSFMEDAHKNKPHLALDTGVAPPSSTIANDKDEAGSKKNMLDRLIDSIFG